MGPARTRGPLVETQSMRLTVAQHIPRLDGRTPRTLSPLRPVCHCRHFPKRARSPGTPRRPSHARQRWRLSRPGTHVHAERRFAVHARGQGRCRRPRRRARDVAVLRCRALTRHAGCLPLPPPLHTKRTLARRSPHSPPHGPQSCCRQRTYAAHRGRPPSFGAVREDARAHT